MDRNTILFWMTVAGTVCWPICFFWMYILSSRQHALLAEIREQARRLEELSKVEHKLLREVHPQVSEIREELAEVADTVKDMPQSYDSR